MHTVGIGTEIRDFVVTNFLFGKGDDLSDEESLLDNGVIDSTGVLELVSYLQERFEMRVEDDEIVPANLDSIRNLVEFVGRKIGR
ncbi:acyl carrier protein [Occallatibacter savannae]|uniref:acyl carrier protein n=1 Tax=Occallatibacter savannae TaxID=1002691 RepID=UPI000D699005|nr:acyl carrier protein [Occallatibacter savannae]